MVNYPTEWTGGKPRGSIKDTKTLYRCTITPPGEKSILKVFYYVKPKRRSKDVKDDQLFNNKEDALKATERWRMMISDEYELTRNKYRYLDKNTIEVQLTQGKTFKTDAKYLDIIEKYPLNCKSKKKNGTERYYVMVQDKKKLTAFHSHISNFKIVEYINGDSLDLRIENLKEFGSVSEIKKIKKSKDMTHKSQALHFKYIDDPWALPRNIWILGKPSGTIFIKDNRYNVRVHHDGRLRSRTFPNTKNGKESAERWRIETSYKLGVTRNLIKIIDHNYIEVMLTSNQIMKGNIELIPLIQKLPLFATISKDDNSKYYVGCSTPSQKMARFHKVITGFDMVDHINGDTLDNTLENLRWCDYSLNNRNKYMDEEDYSGYMGELKNFNKSSDRKSYFKFKKTMYGIDINRRFYLDNSTPESLTKTINQIQKYKHFIRTGEIDPLIVDIITKTDLDKRKQYYKWLITKTKFTDTDSHLKDMGLSDLQRHDINQTIAIWQHKYLNSLYKKAK